MIPSILYLLGWATGTAQVVESEGLEYSMTDERQHYALDESRMHYALPNSKLHYTISDNE